MKKFLSLVLSGILAVSSVSCGGSTDAATTEDTDSANGELTTITVAATVVPHAELLNLVKEDLKAEGVDLVVQEFSDYTLLNPALANGEVDANFFQHQPFLDSFVADSGKDLVSVGNIHLEPMRGYSDTLTSIDELPDGATIALPNDATNEGRGLLLLEAEGLITLNEEAGIVATPKDIIDNPKNLQFIELDSYLLPRSLGDCDLAIISTNVAMESGLDMSKSIVVEGADSPYANIIAVRAEDKENEAILKLVTALQSDKVKTYIEENYYDAVVPAF